MRTVTKLPDNLVGKLKRTPERDVVLEKFLKTDIEDSISEMGGLWSRWTDYIRMYRGIPENAFSSDPIPVRNIEVTVCATACDTLYSQAWDMIMNQSPVVTTRATVKEDEEAAKGFQALSVHLTADTFANWLPATKDYMTDCINLGTGFYYTTWQEDHKKNGFEEVVDWGPRFYSPAPEDIIVPGGSGPDVQSLRMIGFRSMLYEGELDMRARAGKWDRSLAAQTHNANPVSLQRNKASHVETDDHAKVLQYEIYDLFVLYDYDEDGVDEDLYVIYDRTNAKILFMSYMPFEMRPFSVARYQYQSHSFFGMGTMEMGAPLEKEITNWHNFAYANAKLVNSRAWGVKAGSPMSGTKLRIIPNKPLYFNDVDDIKEFRMADVYPSVLQYQQADMQLMERRVGTMTDFAAKPQAGHRTPGMTMLSMLQQINRRFTTAFEEIRGGMADSLFQGIIRLQEKFTTTGPDQSRVEEFIRNAIGSKQAEAVFAQFRKDPKQLKDRIGIEMTASSQSVNREADKQSALQMLTMLGQYYEKVLQVATMAVSPQMPPQLKPLAVKLVVNMSEAMDRFLRTFDQVRDPSALLFSEEDFNALMDSMSQGGGGAPGTMGSPEGAAPGGAGGDVSGQDMGGNANMEGAGADGSEPFPLSGGRA